MTVEYFKATRNTKRFRGNQKVWIRRNYGNHMEIYFKWRGRGRYVSGIIDKFDNKAVGEIKAIEVDDSFALRILAGVGDGEI